MKEYIKKIVEGQDMNQEEMSDSFDLIMAGKATAVQIAGFIVALRMKGETVEEIAGAASSMRRHAVFIDTSDIDRDFIWFIRRRRCLEPNCYGFRLAS